MTIPKLNTMYLGYLIGVVSLVYTIFTSYVYFFPRNPIDVYSPFKINTPKVIAGQDTVYTASYCKYDDSHGLVYRTIIGPEFIPLPSVESIVPKGCNTATVHIKIDRDTTPGIYHIEGVGEYKVAGNRIVSKRFYTEDFEVIASDSGRLK